MNCRGNVRVLLGSAVRLQKGIFESFVSKGEILHNVQVKTLRYKYKYASTTWKT